VDTAFNLTKYSISKSDGVQSLAAFPEPGTTSAAVAVPSKQFFRLEVGIMNATGLRLRSIEFSVARGSQGSPAGYFVAAYSKSVPTPVALGTADVQSVAPSWIKVSMELPSELIKASGTDSLFLVFYSYSPSADEPVHYANVVVKGNLECSPNCSVFTGRRLRKLAMVRAQPLADVAQYRHRRAAAVRAGLLVQHDLQGNMLWTAA
jgi:hypothetical protein